MLPKEGRLGAYPYPVPGTGHSTGIPAGAFGKDRNRIFRNVSIDLSI